MLCIQNVTHVLYIQLHFFSYQNTVQQILLINIIASSSNILIPNRPADESNLK